MLKPVWSAVTQSELKWLNFAACLMSAWWTRSSCHHCGVLSQFHLRKFTSRGLTFLELHSLRNAKLFRNLQRCYHPILGHLGGIHLCVLKCTHKCTKCSFFVCIQVTVLYLYVCVKLLLFVENLVYLPRRVVPWSEYLEGY